MREVVKLLFFIFSLSNGAILEPQPEGSRQERVLSVFNVVRFPNDPCGASNGRNGTCFTASECSAKGGSSSGTCASSFGVCCVFSLACGGSTSANNSYAIISSFNVATDTSPCTYTFCKSTSDVCKLRIDYTTMEIAGPRTVTAAGNVQTDSTITGDCETDTLTVTNPDGRAPPVICGFNTGQHMWVPASDQCNQININIDTANTGTTRMWEIKVTQYECDNPAAPTLDCLQYHTAAMGTIASFNFDTSSTTVSTTAAHLSHQYYDICIRRESGKCSICYDVHIKGTSITAPASFGISAGTLDANQKSAIGAQCTGVTKIDAVANSIGYGDYLDIPTLHGPAFSATTIKGIQKICGSWFNAAPNVDVQATACTFANPFKVGVHFDGDENIAAAADVAGKLAKVENGGIVASATTATEFPGQGFQGFWLNYWQESC